MGLETGVFHQLKMLSFWYHTLTNSIVGITITIGIFWILRNAFHKKNSKTEASASSIREINTNENVQMSSNQSQSGKNPALEILGPKAPQEIKFIVTTPPSDLIPLYHPKCTSIKRQLVFNLQKMTWERRKPVGNGNQNDAGSPDTAVNPSKNSRSDAKDSIKDKMTWELVDHSLPIESLLNVSAHVDRLGTLDFTFDSSIVEKRDLLPENLTVKQVTIDTWKNFDGDKKKRKKDERALNEGLGLELNEYSDTSTINNGTAGGASTAGGDESTSSNATHMNRKEDKGVARKGRSLEAKKEYTFLTEFEAGAFQTLFLTARIVGKEIQNLYSALELVHKRSEAFGGDVHDNISGGVALDDVQRCVSDLSFVDKRLGRIYDLCRIYDRDSHQQQEVNDSNVLGGSEIEGAINEQQSLRQEKVDLYKHRRSVLGFVDFFWLFVPSVLHGTPYTSPRATHDEDAIAFDDTVGGIDEHQARVQQLIKIRQRVAKAAVRVRSYVNNMEVVQNGWKIPTPNISCQLRTRLAYDNDDANIAYDCMSTHECYDPMLSRGHSSSTATISDEGSKVLPMPQQAYALVGCQVVRLPQDAGSDFVSFDPLILIPSLRTIVEKHPDLQFFVACLLQAKPKAATIMIYSRWLPEQGEDCDFDSSFDNFSKGSIEERNELIQIRIKVGSKPCSLFSSIFNTSAKKNTPWKSFSTKSLSDGNVIHHFGGSVQSDPLLPKNYLAFSCQIRTDAFSEQWRKVLGNIVPSSGTGNLVELVLELGGSHRSLAATRIVHCESNIMSWEELSSETLSLTNHSLTDENGPDNKNRPDFENTRSMEDHNAEVETLKEILSLITVPVRASNNSSKEEDKETITNGQILHFFSDNELLKHFIAANENLKEAAIRITKSAAFRGLTFPIDTRSCQVELRSGQFFQQGYDLSGNPVFYFFNMCVGLWRKNIDASIAATLYTLDEAIRTLAKKNPMFKCTVVVLMGKVNEPKSNSEQDALLATDERTSKNFDEPMKKKAFYVHTNFQFVQRLVGIVSQNYPERLGQAIVVPSGGWEKLIGAHGLRRYVQSSKTRSKITVVDNVNDLKNYISMEQLIDIAGGESQTAFVGM